MKRFTSVAALLFLCAVVAGPVAAADDTDEAGNTSLTEDWAEEGDKKFDVHGELRFRGEYLDNFTDGVNSDAGFDKDSGSFAPYRARLAAKSTFGDHVRGYVNDSGAGGGKPAHLHDRPDGPAPGASFCLDQANSPGLHPSDF